MASFYNQEDQDIYAGGDHFIPQQYYRLGNFNNTVAPVPPEITQQTTQNFGIPYTNAFTNAGGGDGVTFSNTNKFGLDMDSLKTIQSGKWTGSEYEKTPREIAQDAQGNWKDVNTNQNVYHGNLNVKGPATMILDKVFGKTTTGDPYKNTWTGTEWDDEFDPTVADKNLNAVQRWRAKKDFAAAQKKIARDEAIDAGTAEPDAGGGGGEGSGPVGPQFRDKDYADPGVDAEENQPYNNQGGWNPGGERGQSPTGGDVAGTPFAQGGRIGFNKGGNYAQNAVANQLFGSSFDVLDPFQQDQIDSLISQVGTTSLGALKKADGGRVGFFYGGLASIL
mgnify:CR=1 FL=1